jgi:membrane associated rhomboid family serine protease
VIPLRDHNPTQSRPYLVYALVALNALVWLYEVAIEWTEGDAALALFVQRFGVIPYYLVEEPSPGSWVTPLTSMFMHGGWLHVIGNMWFLWVFGDNVEDRLGKVRFAVFYLACGLAAAAAQIAIDPASRVPMVGASGAIAGVLAAYVVLHPRARVTTLVPFIFLMFVELPAWVFIFVWFGMQLINGLGSLALFGEQTGGVAFFAHIGGFVAGLALIKLLAPRGPRSPREPRVRHVPRERGPSAERPEWGYDRRRELH